MKTDKSIISDLPEKVELSEWVGLSKEQKSLYNKTVEDTLDAIAPRPAGQRHGQVLALLTRLKQICNHPALAQREGAVDDEFLGRSAKLHATRRNPRRGDRSRRSRFAVHPVR